MNLYDDVTILYKEDEKGKLLYATYTLACDEESRRVMYMEAGTVGWLPSKRETVRLSDVENDESRFHNFFLEKFENQGFHELPDNKFSWLVVQFPMKSLKGSKRDHWLKDKVVSYLQDELLYLFLGKVDGWDMGATSNKKKFALNIYCIVVNEKKATSVIKSCLREYRLDYTWIKIASRPNVDGTEYQLKYSAKKDYTFDL